MIAFEPLNKNEQKERAGALAEVVAVNQKCEKLERYARTLTGQRNEMEKEIKRLNEVITENILLHVFTYCKLCNNTWFCSA